MEDIIAFPVCNTSFELLLALLLLLFLFFFILVLEFLSFFNCINKSLSPLTSSLSLFFTSFSISIVSLLLLLLLLLVTFDSLSFPFPFFSMSLEPFCLFDTARNSSKFI